MDPLSSGAPDLAGHVERLARRLRSLSEVRLARPLPGHASRADAARALAQQLADAASRLEGLPVRTVPRLHDFAVGDQVAVTGHDLAAAGSAGGPDVQAVLDLACLACRELAAAL